ncbi:NAD-dependent epimerase/dehydratase family protein [Halobacteriovorax sp. CON-3]|uniref:NAD-dependent epimerase/dehydratase family protein n=1 Tax=Halobacteriovorax sp. CON-3 TaxID=3157710 RepID=UPI0037247EBC
MNSKRSILIIGASGGLSNILCGLLAKRIPDARIIGIDSRRMKNEVDFENFTFHRMRYTRRNFEKLFRENRFETIYQIGRITPPGGSAEERLSFSLINTSKVLELAEKYSIKKFIMLSTFHVYGAQADNPVFINEDYPLKVSIKHPELRDVTEVDALCTNWMWKNRENIETVVLRPCNIIGPQIDNTISRYLTSNMTPVPIDFNPMMQFIHEYDMANILFQSLDKLPTGVYNVAPGETISLQEAKKITGTRDFPFPVFTLEVLSKAIRKIWPFPSYFIDFVMYSCVIDNSKINQFIPEDIYQYDSRKTLSLIRKG